MLVFIYQIMMILCSIWTQLVYILIIPPQPRHNPFIWVTWDGFSNSFEKLFIDRFNQYKNLDLLNRLWPEWRVYDLQTWIRVCLLLKYLKIQTKKYVFWIIQTSYIMFASTRLWHDLFMKETKLILTRTR